MSNDENEPAVQVVYTEVTDSVAFSQIQDLQKAKKVNAIRHALLAGPSSYVVSAPLDHRSGGELHAG